MIVRSAWAATTATAAVLPPKRLAAEIADPQRGPMSILLLWILTAGGMGAGPATGSLSRAELSVESLLNDLNDLDRLTRLPEPAYVTRQFSSYNRASKTPADREGWFANMDRGHFLRSEQNGSRQEYVMMDVAGPGAIVRIWSASDRGTLRFYLDGSETPVFEAPMNQLLGGKYPDIPEPLAGCRARGWNLYYPVPYARHCKVTTDAERIFYHINYRTYPAGTLVRSFRPDDLKHCSGQVANLSRRLSTPRAAVDIPATRKVLSFHVDLEPNVRDQLIDARGPASVCEFTVKCQAENVSAALRGCVLEMHFDDLQTVECPLGDFFGTAPGLTPYASLPMGVADDSGNEMWCHWRMPFERIASFQVRNLGDHRCSLRGRLAVVPFDFDARTCYFHAGWRIERDIPSRPFTDWTHLQCSGTGRFLGGALQIMNPVRKWWGEGDEKIYVDGESFPSHFGTGSEDYYGYAWCSPERFTHAYHNQPRCDGPGNYGNTSVSRFHIIDDIPFTRALRFDMENWHHNPITCTTRAAVSYWYARPGAQASFQPLDRKQVAPVIVPPYETPRVAGAIEAESMRVLTPESVAGPLDADERFSGGRQLLWSNALPAHRLELAFNCDASKECRAWARLVLGRQAPRVQLHLNGRPVGEVVDLSHSRTTPTELEIDLGRCRLAAGENRLIIEVVAPGAQSPAAKAFVVGFDYLRIE